LEGNKISTSNGEKTTFRRKKAFVSTLGTTQLHLRNPFIVAFWSVMFPGLGHMLISKYLRGWILFIWEITINLMAHINLAIFYSLTGNFDLAKTIIDKRWVLLYIPTFLFAVCDSYRTTVDLNQQYILAAREDAEIEIFKMGSLEVNYIDKTNPQSSAVWSAFMPGIGQLSSHIIPESFFILIWWIVIVYFSNVLPAIQYTMTGNLVQGMSVIDKQWFLNIPSVYLFSIYAAYTKAVELNNLFDWEQSKYLNKNYQNNSFHMPANRNNNRGEHMYIISTFEHSISLESAITAIQMKGIDKKDILAVPLDKRGEERQLFDTLHRSDGLSMLDIPMISASVFALLGSIYGFVLLWGPIIWGIIGTVIGFGLGLAVKLFTIKKYSNRINSKETSEVVLIIECKDTQLESVKDTLWAHDALGVRKLNLGNECQ
jgi:hypothetical protein